jgi:hypothetical protein
MQARSPQEPTLPRFNPSFLAVEAKRQRNSSNSWLQRQRRRAYWRGFTTAAVAAFIGLAIFHVITTAF